MKTLRVALLEDNVYDIQEFEKSLQTKNSYCSFELRSALDIPSFTAILESEFAPNMAILDVNLGKGLSHEGLAFCKVARKKHPHLVIIMRSNIVDTHTVAQSLQTGADDFISKKSKGDDLAFRLFQSYNLALLKSGRGAQKQPSPAVESSFVGQTFAQLSQRIPLILNSAISTVHIYGESGTGKEEVATLFQNHLGHTVPFSKINCAAIAPQLLESELFGYVKGAFTGAAGNKVGFIEHASGGWIFLDEVATLSLSAQAALLRVIENQEILPVGATTPRKINIRVLSAANQSIPEMVEEGKFRLDLWQRLSEKTISLPPLRERPSEIPELIKFFCRTMRGGPYQISDTALDLLASAPWSQGNIRELRNCLKSMTEFAAEKLLTPLAIPESLWKSLDEKPEADRGSHELQATENLMDITLKLNAEDGLKFEPLLDRLMLKVLELATSGSGKISLRNLSRITGLSRTALCNHFRGLVERQAIDADELNKLVNFKAS